MLENPASRLHSILEKAYAISDERHLYKYAWSQVFKVNQEDNVALHQNINGMIELYKETLKLVETNERLNIPRNIQYLKNIEKAIFSINFNGTMNDFFESLDSETLSSLYFIGELIDSNSVLNESKVDNEKVDEILGEINDLIYSISESLLPKDVQDILMNNLINIRDALYKYRFFGEEALKKALEQTIGSISINKSIIDENQDDIIYPRVGDVLGKTSSLITIGTAVKEYLLPLFDKLPIK